MPGSRQTGKVDKYKIQQRELCQLDLGMYAASDGAAQRIEMPAASPAVDIQPECQIANAWAPRQLEVMGVASPWGQLLPAHKLQR
jgi:hypothetical protein